MIGKNVSIGKGTSVEAHAVLEDGVILGENNRIRMGVFIASGTEIGHHNDIHMHAVIGHEPQDLAYKNEPSKTFIGDHNQIREFATIHRGTKAGTATVIGNHNYIMAYCHLAHNVRLGNKVIMVNNASLTGYCEVDDGAFLSGMTGFHQFSRIGRLAMVRALSAVNKDIPPFIVCGGRPGVAVGINVVGMRRAGIGAEARMEIKQAFKLLYRSGLNTTQALEAIKNSLKSPEAAQLAAFIENSKRGIIDAATDSDTLQARKGAGGLPAAFDDLSEE
jgi:UDP-N-acetylglucosamine acyltransferase